MLYQPEGEVRLEVRVENETVWLTQVQMARLFGRDRSVIAKHIKNAFKEGELDPKVVCANFAHTYLFLSNQYAHKTSKLSNFTCANFAHVILSF